VSKTKKIERKNFNRFYIPCFYFTENSPECMNCEDRYRCKRNGNNIITIHTTFKDPFFDDPYKRYIMGD